MQVIKRNGETEEFNYDKIEKVVKYACSNEEDSKEFLDDLKLNIKNNMNTKDIHRTVTQLATEKIGAHSTHWDAVASKLYLYNVIKEASLNRGYSEYKYGDFYDLIVMLTDKGLYHKSILENYTKEEIDELGQYIKCERDFLFPYAGIRLLTERYLIKGFEKEVLELPQELFMGNAMSLMRNETNNKIQQVKDLYNTSSLHNLTLATPTFANARKPLAQLSSCFKLTIDDSLESIYNVNSLSAQLSKWGGGIGISASKIRSAGSSIQGHKGLSTGIVPWLKNLNNTALSVDQLAQRKGAFAVYLDVWHKDIFDFLHLKSPTGDQRLRCYDLFTGLVLNNVFMKQVQNKGKYYLFCPHEIKTTMGWPLEDFYGEEFEAKYWECVNNPALSKEEVKAMDIYKELIKSATETGTPYLMFRDICNEMNPNKHKGIIYSSNVCSEILQNMSADGPLKDEILKKEDGKMYVVHTREAGDTVVCNLSSLNLGNVYNNDEKLKQTIKIAIRAMDNVIDLNYYPISEAEITNKKYRAVGLGVSNYAYMLAKENISWDSEKHLQFVDKLFEKINFYAIEASMELAKEKGAYSVFKGSDWDTGEYFKLRNYNSTEWLELAEKVHKYGIRNGYLMAIAPTASTSVLIGSTAGIDPIFSRFFLEQKKNGAVAVFPPELENLWWFYKEAHLVSQEYSIKAAAIRARHIDQGQSTNLYITPQTSASEIAKLYLLAWKKGIRTIYYTRSLSTEIEDCLSCSS